MYNGVKVFTVTKAKDREYVGDDIGRWIADHPECKLVDKVVVQSSDREFHCLSIVLFYYYDSRR